MGQRILVILGHPQSSSYAGAAADSYTQSAIGAGHDVRTLRLGELVFDPLLRYGYRDPQPLEPDLVDAQTALTWAEHTVWVFPVWWGSMPALLKGFIDRVFLPGFAYRFHSGQSFPEKLLKGRTAHLIVPMDTPPWYFRWIYRMPAIRQLSVTTLDFCGVRPTGILMLGPVIHSTHAQRTGWLDKVSRLAESLPNSAAR